MKIPFPKLAPLVKREKPKYSCMNRTVIYRPENISVCKLYTTAHQKKVMINKVISILKQCLQLAYIRGIFSFVQHLYIQRKATKKFNFELLCLFYVPYDIQLLMCFKESRSFVFFYDCYVLGYYRRSKYNYQDMFFYI